MHIFSVNDFTYEKARNVLLMSDEGLAGKGIWCVMEGGYDIIRIRSDKQPEFVATFKWDKSLSERQRLSTMHGVFYVFVFHYGTLGMFRSNNVSATVSDLTVQIGDKE